jgi:hypothetical protein
MNKLSATCISWWEQVTFNEMIMRFPPPSFVLEHAQLHCYSVNSLKQQSADRYVAPLRQIILISSQPVYALAS